MNTILLIEDNVELLDNTTEILELANYKVIKAENGKVGLEKIKQNKGNFSLILCDIMMPELDGYGVLRAIENMPELNGIPFIFLTAKTEKADMRKGMDLGADDYLVKPYTSEELLNVINSRLKKARNLKELVNSNVREFEQLFNNPSEFTQHELFREKFRSKKFNKKEAVYLEGQETIYLYYILNGKVKTTKTNDLGKDYVTNIYKEGDFFGYNSILSNGGHETNAIALENTELAMLPKADFFELLYSSRHLCGKFIGHIASLLNETEDKLLNLAYNSARKKVAEALVYISKKYNDTDDNIISFSVSRDDLSSISGIAPESVSRNLTDFRSEKLINMDNGKLIILDLKKLESLRN